MANQITDNRTLIHAADVVTPYVDLSGAGAGSLDTEIFIQGTGSIGLDIGSSLDGILYDAGSAQDWSSNTFYFWINCGIVGLLDTKANGGFRIRFCGATVTDWFEVYVAGSDSWPTSVSGGWSQFVVDIETARSAAVTNGWTNGTTPATSAIQYAGWAGITGGTMPRMVDNTWLDEIRRLPDGSPGIIVEGRNGGTVDWDSADIATQLGVATGTFIVTAGGAYKVNTPIQFGINDTTTHGFSDTNAVWLWDDQEFLPNDVYALSALGNVGGVTNVTLGVKTGIGDDATGAQGVIISAAATGARWAMDFNDPNLDSIDLYGCTFIHGDAFLLDDPAVEAINCIYLDGLSATISNSLQLRNKILNAATADGVAYMITDDISDIRFCEFSFSDGHGIEITSDVVDPQSSKGNLFSAYLGTPGSNLVANSGSTDAAIYNTSGQALQINITDGGDTPSVRNGVGATTTISQSVTVKVTCLNNDDGLPIEGVAVILGTGPGLTDVIDNVLTDVLGVVSVSYSGATPDNLEGYAAKGSEEPVFVRAPISGTVISGTGFDQTINMVPD